MIELQWEAVGGHTVNGYQARTPLGVYTVAMKYPKCWAMKFNGEQLYQGPTLALAKHAAARDVAQREGVKA